MITKNGFSRHIVAYKELQLNGKTLTRQALRFKDLPYKEREKIRKVFYKALGWDYWMFSRKKNGRVDLTDSEQSFIEKYFEIYKNQ